MTTPALFEPPLLTRLKAADRIHNIRDALASHNTKKRKDYLVESERDLLPILREAGEDWMVARLEELLERLSDDGASYTAP